MIFNPSPNLFSVFPNFSLVVKNFFSSFVLLYAIQIFAGIATPWQAYFVLGKLDFGLGKLDFVLGKLDFGLGKLDFGLGKFDFGLGKLDFVLGKLDFVLGKLDFVLGKLDFVLGKLDFGLGKFDLVLGNSILDWQPDLGLATQSWTKIPLIRIYQFKFVISIITLNYTF